MSLSNAERLLRKNGWRQVKFEGGVAVWVSNAANIILLVSPVSTFRTVVRVMNSVVDSD